MTDQTIKYTVNLKKHDGQIMVTLERREGGGATTMPIASFDFDDAGLDRAGRIAGFLHTALSEIAAQATGAAFDRMLAKLKADD